MESANIGKTAPKPEFLDEAEQGDGRLKEEGEAQSGESDEVGWWQVATGPREEKEGSTLLRLMLRLARRVSQTCSVSGRVQL